MTTSPDRFITRVRDVTTFKVGGDVLQIGTFGSPPQLPDVDHLVWEHEDLEAMRRCRIGDCDVQLTASAIDQLRREVNWRSPGADARALAVVRRMLVDLAAAYLLAGDGALQPYRDDDPPVDPCAEFRAIASESPSPLDLASGFRRYLIDFPKSAPGRVENLLYWSKERIAYHTVVSVNHMAIFRPTSVPGLPVLVASKQIYASRYITASLAVTALVPVDEAGRSVDLLYLNRSRTDAFDGFAGRLIRPIVRSRVRAAVAKYMREAKTKLEH